ncbi:MAG: hypothetical protein COT71_03570 [Candidatus Andersenbacteria bacterium CG10_big_fil_rev_8_21_14_0_10_54_11]|uniref:Uncharacterized protein n=1 Tax=Candidatus Andersenbacteria bacterium CG10_big_fil_rev_8_21_14_0_10_54_11 TaxID=1974485 RepID=A0A2M6WYN6_9BACT|nr:MAG: hypothetical protein COT71_03570 [Candidatus Andersenbacteria bacterium CG10_big_fil_rev_8_21_14_0_10_54_11]
MQKKFILFIISALLFLAAGGGVFMRTVREVRLEPMTSVNSPSGSKDEQAAPAAVPNSPAAQPQAVRQLDVSAVPETHAAFGFRSLVPADWLAEAVPGIEAVNIYDPAAEGNSRLEQSQIFLRHFRANDFLTLSSVHIYSRTPVTVVGRPAMTYDVEKLRGAADFPQQPAWRNTRHTVTDVRVSNDNPSEFIVIGKRPEVPQEVFNMFLHSMDFKEAGLH